MNDKNQSGGVGICGLLFVLFVGLKLAGIIAWSWWWVTAPLWMPITIVLGFALLCLAVAGVVELVTKK